MSEKISNTKKTTEKVSPIPTGDFIFGKENYVIMAVGVFVIILGFYLMAGKENILEDKVKITVAPILILIGFVIGIFAIMKPKKD
ncbi:MAG: DUF3098 domain-containing protein [Bacteroidia bacterium]